MPELPPVYVIIGTRAQFIKMAPLLRAMRDQSMPYKLLYTAQHQENISEILQIYGLPEPDVVMYHAEEANTPASFLRWAFSIFFKALFKARMYLDRPGLLLTHGDTFTAWMAAIMGRRAGCVVAHVESGCRSHNLLSPFPEEISRLITFRLSDVYFCADEWAVENLRRYRGAKINMGANTMVDGVRFALSHPSSTPYEFASRPYAMVSIHRFENIFTRRFQEEIIPILREVAQEHHLVVTLHPTTRERLMALGLFNEVDAHPNITLHERFGFIDWINLCNQAQFVITDGGSNQEELSYLGVPTLLLRNETERREGLGRNVVISRFDRAVIREFLANLETYRFEPASIQARPSDTIVETLRGLQIPKSK